MLKVLSNKTVFKMENIICRLFSSWLIYIFFNSFSANKTDLSFMQESSIKWLVLFSVGYFAIISVFVFFLNNDRIDSLVLLTITTFCSFRWLTLDIDDEKSFLYTLAVLIIFLLFVLYCVNKNYDLFSKLNINNKKAIIFYIIIALISGAVISVITCLRYKTFSTPNFDFGLFVNMFHNMKTKGLPLSTSERDVLLTHFAVHISPIYYIILPFYYIIPSPLTLQIAQAVILLSGIAPLVLLCKKYGLYCKTTLTVSIIFSLYPALSAGTFYDIHENCFLVPLLLWTFFFFEKEKYALMYIFAALTLAVKEDAAVYIIIFALFVILSRKKYLHGAVMLVTAAAYFIIAMNLLDLLGEYYAGVYTNSSANPAINGAMVNRYDNLIFDKSDGIFGVIKTALKNPAYLLTQILSTKNGDFGKLKYLLQMLLPLGFMPFITKKVSRYILILPILVNLLTDYMYQYDIGFQYHFGILAFLFYVTVMNLSELQGSVKRNIITVASVSCFCLYLTTVSPYLQSYLNDWNTNKDMYKDMEKIIDTIPKDASVCASSMLVSHLADREEVYQIEYHDYEDDTDFVVFDTRYKNQDEGIEIYLSKGYSISCEFDNITILIKEK